MIEIKLIDSMARTAWVTTWADWNDEHGSVNVSQMELMDIAPETPEMAKVLAAMLLGRYIERFGYSYCVAGMVSQAAEADGIPWEEVCSGLHDKWLSDLGHSLVMMALGSGVSWFDDHEEFNCPNVYVEYTISDFFATSEEWENSDYAIEELENTTTK